MSKLLKDMQLVYQKVQKLEESNKEFKLIMNDAINTFERFCTVENGCSWVIDDMKNAIRNVQLLGEDDIEMARRQVG